MSAKINDCHQPRFRAAYMAVRELNISKEAFAEALDLSLSAVQQKISLCSLPSHSHSTEEQALKAEKLLSDLLEMKAGGARVLLIEEPLSTTSDSSKKASTSGSYAAISSTLVKPVKTKSKRFLTQIEAQNIDGFDPEKFKNYEITGKDGELIATILSAPTYNQGEARWEALASIQGMLAIIEISLYQL